MKAHTVRRALIRDVLEPLAKEYPTEDGEQGFRDGRLHSFRHYFCSTCAKSGVPEQMLMAWLGHADSEMVRHYYHLNDELARRKMNEINFLGKDWMVRLRPEVSTRRTPGKTRAHRSNATVIDALLAQYTASMGDLAASCC